MKKNLFIGAIATVFAVGSAFAPFASERAYVWAKTACNQTVYTCTATSVFCDNAGSVACRVQVNLSAGGTKTVNGRRQSLNCVPILTHSGGVIIAPDTFCDVQ